MTVIYALLLGLAIAIIAVEFEVIMDFFHFINKKMKVPAWRGWVVRGVAWVLIWLITKDPVWSALMYFGVHFISFDHLMGWLMADNWFHLGTTKWWDKALQWIQGKIPFHIFFVRLMVSIALISLYFFPNGYLRTWPF
ncbi:MAG: hypothetical protein ACFB2Y_16920 [Fulvivirga sp.]